MFKIRIKKWGLKKYKNANKALSVLQLKRERDAIGKKSEFILCEGEVNRSHIQRYIKRSHTLQAKLNSGCLEIGGHTQGLICRTPSPDPAMLISVPDILETSDELRVIDEATRIMRGLCQSMRDTERRSRATVLHPDPRIVRLRAWYFRMEEAIRHIEGGSLNRRFSILDDCCDLSKQLLQEQHPHLFFYFDDLRRTKFKNETLRRMFTGFVKQLAQITLGERHPVTLLWTRYTDHTDCLALPLKTAEVFLDFSEPYEQRITLLNDICASYMELFRQCNDNASFENNIRAIGDQVQDGYKAVERNDLLDLLQICRDFISHSGCVSLESESYNRDIPSRLWVSSSSLPSVAACQLVLSFCRRTYKCDLARIAVCQFLELHFISDLRQARCSMTQSIHEREFYQVSQ